MTRLAKALTKRNVLVLFFVILIGFALRFFQLGSVPHALHRDEAFLGYNAFSLLTTGRDMTGNSIPLHLESFIYSPAGYSYFSILPVGIFGLSGFSIRFASAFFGVLTIILTYMLTKRLFRISQSEQVALVSALFLAISPWHINLSRTATENTIVVFFILLGVLLYTEWLTRKAFVLLFCSFLSFSITLFLYQAPRAFLPFFLPLMLFFLPHILQKRASFKLPIIFFIVTIMLPLVLIFLSPNLSLRIRTVSLFASEETTAQITELIPQDTISMVPAPFIRFFHNKGIGYGMQFLDNYFAHFSYSFLFTDNGFPDRYRVPLMGLLYVVELPFLFLGFWSLFSREKKLGWFLLGWMLLAPLGSALAFDDVPNLQRTLLMVPVFTILVAYGFVTLFSGKHGKMSRFAFFGTVLFLFLQCLFYLHQYHTHLRFYRPWYRQDGYEELVGAVSRLSDKFSHIIITDRESAPTIFFLFYNRYDAARFQAVAKVSKLRDFDRVGFAKYQFSQEECPLPMPQLRKEKIREDTLYVNSGLCKIPPDAKVYAQVKRGDASTAFYILSLPRK